jgi:hypothetical protein
MSRRITGALRDDVRRRAGDRCEYCGIANGKTLYSHHIDHIVPPYHGGDDSESNLAWACFQCNSAKSGNIASYDLLTGGLTPLFHPRIHIWIDHFSMQVGVITALTPIGRVTERVLQMNTPDQVEVRQRLLRRNEW